MNEFKLSKFPLLGNWQLVVNVNEETRIKNIEVGDYELPKFDVTIDSPKHFTIRDGTIRILVRSKYTYGKFVKGKAVVTLSAVQQYFNAATEKIKINGKGAAEFGIDSDIYSTIHQRDADEMDCKVDVMVIDDLTGMKEKEFRLLQQL